MPRSAAKDRSTRRGTLRIGDQWNAINIIARSQTHPLKAVCELVENAIDAKAGQIQIMRRRHSGQVYLEIADDGMGIGVNADGEPDFARIATHVCDSMKRHLANGDRRGIHGEFGIGLLSFWSLGQSLRMISAGTQGALMEMELQAGKKDYVIRPVRGQLAVGGTRVVVGPLADASRKLVTGERLVRYLAAELRDRIRASGVNIQVIDRLLHKQLLVRPQEFVGERLPCDEFVSTAHGSLRVELYLRDRADGPSDGVAVCKDGTRVLRSLAELEIFQRQPWNEGTLEGVLDYPAFELAPGTRSGIVPDDRLNAFVAAVERIESAVVQLIESRQQARAERASQQILRQLRKAFATALRELPPSEYLFFDLPKPQDAAETNGRGDQEAGDEPSGMPLPVKSTSASETPTGEAAVSEEQLFPFEPGPLASVIILPKHPRARPGGECSLRAAAFDEHGRRAAGEVLFTWRIVDGDGTIDAAAETCRASSSTAGLVVVAVEATQGSTVAAAQATVKFVAARTEADDDSPKGLPSYRISAEHGKPWRSRYDDKKNEIVINSAHRDFAASRATLAKHRRYIGKLYA
ncbi:MAG TPA: ATP-binding protein, partial [Pirellulales bacterium]